MRNHSEGRLARRVSVSHEVILEYGGRCMRVPAMDISPRGIAVWAPGKAPAETLRITMAVDGRPVILRGRVARQFESDGGAVWGIEFYAEGYGSEEDLQILTDYVDALA